MITFQKSLAAAVLTGAVALATPVLVHAQAARAGGSTTTSGTVQAPASNGASQAAGANAAGAASESSGQNLSPNGANTNTTTGTYGGMGTDQPGAKAKKPTSSTTTTTAPNNMAPPPH